jgi:hypothetical protein
MVLGVSVILAGDEQKSARRSSWGARNPSDLRMDFQSFKDLESRGYFAGTDKRSSAKVKPGGVQETMQSELAHPCVLRKAFQA